MLDEVLAGLGNDPKTLPSKYFYDETGALLFETICTLPEYYPTRTELAILDAHAGEMAEALGPRVRLIEPGSGSLDKVRFLLDRLVDPVAVVPIDIAGEQLEQCARLLEHDYPDLLVQPVLADYTQDLDLPPAPIDSATGAVYYPGSTIGNFAPDEAIDFLSRLRRIAGEGGAVLVGVDLKKDVDVLIKAYDDSIGVTAAFNENLLARLRHELDAEIDVTGFDHRAVYEADPSRIVMQLVSRREQTVRVGGAEFAFASGEVLTTEYSHKPSLDDFAATAARAGLRVDRVWTDPAQWFSVQLLRPAT